MDIMAELHKLGKWMELSGYITLGVLGISFLTSSILSLLEVDIKVVLITAIVLSCIVAFFQILYLIQMVGLGFGQPRIRYSAILIITGKLAEIVISSLLGFANSVNIWVALILAILIPIPTLIGYILFKKWINENAGVMAAQIGETTRFYDPSCLKNYLKLELERVGHLIFVGVFISFLGLMFAGEYAVILGSMIELFGILKIGKIFQGKFNANRIFRGSPTKYMDTINTKTGRFSMQNGAVPILSMIFALYSLLWGLWYMVELKNGDGFLHDELPYVLFYQIFSIPLLAVFVILKINDFDNTPCIGAGIITLLTFSSSYWIEDFLSILLYLPDAVIMGTYISLIIGIISLIILVKIRPFDEKGSNILLVNVIPNVLQIFFGIRFIWKEDVNMDLYYGASLLLWIVCSVVYFFYFAHSMRFETVKLPSHFYVTRFKTKNLIRAILLMGVCISACKFAVNVYYQIFAGMDGTISILDSNWELYSALSPIRYFLNGIAFTLELVILLVFLKVFMEYSQLRITSAGMNDELLNQSKFQKEISKRSTRIIVSLILIVLLIGRGVTYIESYSLSAILDSIGLNWSSMEIQLFQEVVYISSVVLSSIGMVILILKGFTFNRDYIGLILGILAVLGLISVNFIYSDRMFANTGSIFPIISSLLTGALLIYFLFKYKMELSHNVDEFQLSPLKNPVN